jgi:hypothetical protein
MPWTFFNSSGEALTSFGPVALTDLDIDGGTAIGEAVVGADLFIMDNGAGGTNVKVTATEIATFIAVPAQAVEAAIEAETNQDTYIPPDLAKHIPGAAKFWCDILLAGGLTGTDYNVASVTDNAVGHRTVVYTTAMAEANYPVQVTNRGQTNYGSTPFTESHTTAQCDFRIRRTESSYALHDERNNVTGFGLA